MNKNDEMPVVERYSPDGYEKGTYGYTKMTGMNLPKKICSDKDVKALESYTRTLQQRLEKAEEENILYRKELEELHKRNGWLSTEILLSEKREMIASVFLKGGE